MTAKDFRALAYELLEVRPPNAQTPEYRAWLACVNAVADVCDRHYEGARAFDRDRFLNAAGVGGGIDSVPDPIDPRD